MTLQFDKVILGTLKSADVNVLPSVSNPTSKTLPLTPRERNLPPVPLKTSHKPSTHIKPVNPSEFSSDCAKGHAFLISCNLYFVLVLLQFADDHAKIMWALSFMKSEQASRFVDQKMRMYDVVGSLNYVTWQEFVTEFCPKHEVQTSQTDLETTTYFQGSRTVNEYVDSFKEIVDKACYFEGSHIVLKFRQGLNAKIQDHVACLTQGCPSDEIPQQWYDTAILCDENRIMNTAFTSSPRTS